MGKRDNDLNSFSSRLHTLANNLWWSWNPQAQELFKELSPLVWERTNHNAVEVLKELSRQELVARLHDQDFFQKELCHPAYCLLYLDVCADDAAEYVRRFLQHPRFDTQAKRMGVVARAHHEGIEFWQPNLAARQRANWPEGAKHVRS